MFDQLSDNLQNIFKQIRGESKITEENIDGAIREVRRAFISSDVSLKAIKTFTTRIREKAIGEEVIKGVSPAEQFIKIINDELTELLGSSQKDLNLSKSPSIILMLGLQGAGKTTTCGKLAKLLKKKGKNPLLVPLDLKRPAAIEQLNIIGKQVEIPVFSVSETDALNSDPHKIAENAINFGKQNFHDVIILDSAGRLQVDSDLMAELLLIDRLIEPVEKLLVIDAMIGQEAANIGATFDSQIGITGVVLTKLDGDARGGAALSIVEEIKKPIKLIGIGEKLDDLQEFYPDRMASRILGMGDVLTLVEQAQEKIKEDEAIELQKKLFTDFNFDSFLQALNMTSKLGDFGNLFNMMGVGGMLNKFGVNLSKDDKEKMLTQGEVKIKKYKAAISSMTVLEKKKPDLLNSNRKRRVAKGCGQKEKDIDLMVTEFKQMKKMMDNLKPLMGMMGSGNSMPMPSPAMFNPGGPRMGSGLQAPRSGLLKGFKPKKK
jgi:signal recognition particle subunit SRP54